jgi:hypothetical protein
MAVGTVSEGTPGETRMASIQAHITVARKPAENDETTTKPVRREIEDETKEDCETVIAGHMAESKPLVLLQVNCRNICNKILEFWHIYP